MPPPSAPAPGVHFQIPKRLDRMPPEIIPCLDIPFVIRHINWAKYALKCHFTLSLHTTVLLRPGADMKTACFHSPRDASLHLCCVHVCVCVCVCVSVWWERDGANGPPCLSGVITKMNIVIIRMNKVWLWRWIRRLGLLSPLLGRLFIRRQKVSACNMHEPINFPSTGGFVLHVPIHACTWECCSETRGGHLCSFVRWNDPCVQYISFHWLLGAIIQLMCLTLKDAGAPDCVCRLPCRS